MEFNSTSQILKAVTSLRANKTGKNMHYPVLFKKGVCQYIYENKDVTAHSLGPAIGIKASNIYTWIEQFKAGLYSLQGAYSVSKKSKSLNAVLLKQLNQKKEEIIEKLEIVEKATAMGLKVTDS